MVRQCPRPSSERSWKGSPSLADIRKGFNGRCCRRPLSIPPETVEATWRKLSVSNRVLDILVTQVGLERSGVVSGIRQRKATGMTKHVGMRLDLKASRLSRPLEHSGEAGRGKWGLALRDKDKRGRRALALQLAQCAHLAPAQGMDAGRPVLGPADMECRSIEVDLIPTEV